MPKKKILEVIAPEDATSAENEIVEKEPAKKKTTTKKASTKKTTTEESEKKETKTTAKKKTAVKEEAPSEEKDAILKEKKPAAKSKAKTTVSKKETKAKGTKANKTSRHPDVIKAGALRRSPTLDQKMEKRKAIKIQATYVTNTKEMGQALMGVSKEGYLVAIPARELDINFRTIKPSAFLGKDVNAVLYDFDKERNMYLGSRKLYQIEKEKRLVERDDKDAVFEGEIVNFLGHGALVRVNTVIGILRDIDWSTDHIKISELYNVGDTIKVKYKKGDSEKHRVEWTAAEKYAMDKNPNFDQLKVGNIYLGTIVKFVEKEDKAKRDVVISLFPGVRCVANEPDGEDVRTGQKCEVYIRSIYNNDGNVFIRSFIRPR